MGCGISTANLPSYMRGGRHHAVKKNGQRGCDDDNVAMMDRHSTYSSAIDLLEDDSSRDQKVTLISPQTKNQQKLDATDAKENDPSSDQKMNVPSPHAKNLPRLVIAKEKEDDILNNNRNISERNNRKGHDGKEDTDGNEDDGSNIGNSSWIGSPSFRDYCGNQRDFEDYDGKSDGENKETKTQEDLNQASPKPGTGIKTQEDLNQASPKPGTEARIQGGQDQASPKPRAEGLASSVERSETTDIKNEGSTVSNGIEADNRRKRGNGFKKVFPAGKKSSALKNFATCYNPNHATSRVGEGN